MVRGITSPQPEQQSVLNFDPCHYLPRRWGLRWGDNLWTLTFNPEAWAGPCNDNLVCIWNKWDKHSELSGWKIQTDLGSIHPQMNGRKNCKFFFHMKLYWKRLPTKQVSTVSACRCIYMVWEDYCTTSFSLTNITPHFCRWVQALFHGWLDWNKVPSYSTFEITQSLCHNCPIRTFYTEEPLEEIERDQEACFCVWEKTDRVMKVAWLI